MSKEHVLRARFAKVFPIVSSSNRLRQVYRKIEDGSIESRDFLIPSSPFDMTVNEVCKSCNEGWLVKKVEDPAEQALVHLMLGRPLLLGMLEKNTAKAIALWSSKTAAVRALVDKGQRAIPPEHYEIILHTLEPPPGTSVWLANIECCSDTFTRHFRFFVQLDFNLAATAHFSTFLLGHLGIFVVGISEPSLATVFKETGAKLDAHNALRIWPEPQSAIWPRSLISLQLAKELSTYVEPKDTFSIGADIRLIP